MTDGQINMIEEMDRLLRKFNGYKECRAMPRMSKKREQEWGFFLNDRNRMIYNPLCGKCCRDCKLSFRADAVECPHYFYKRGKE